MTIKLQQCASQEQLPLPIQPFQEWKLPGRRVASSQFFRLDSGYLLRFRGLADFEVSPDGDRVRCWPVDGTSDSTLQHLFLNQVLPLARSRAGTLMLHASAVAIGDWSVAFLGPSGSGKSTLAASFATTGTRFLTDDGLHIEPEGKGLLLVIPSHPSIRLREDSLLALAGQTASLGAPLECAGKARLLAEAGLPFCEEPRPLKALYFLGDHEAEAVSVRPLSSREALLGLVRNSFLLGTDEREMLARHFDQLSLIANQPIHYQLDYPRRYSELPNVRQAVTRYCVQD